MSEKESYQTGDLVGNQLERFPPQPGQDTSKAQEYDETSECQNAEERLQSSNTAANTLEKLVEKSNDQPLVAALDTGHYSDPDDSPSCSKRPRKSIKKKESDDLTPDEDISKTINKTSLTSNEKRMRKNAKRIADLQNKINFLIARQKINEALEGVDFDKLPKKTQDSIRWFRNFGNTLN